VIIEKHHASEAEPRFDVYDKSKIKYSEIDWMKRLDPKFASREEARQSLDKIIEDLLKSNWKKTGERTVTSLERYHIIEYRIKVESCNPKIEGKVKLYTTEGDSKEELKDMMKQLERHGIEYEICNGGLISERYKPIAQINGTLYEGSRQLFNYFNNVKKKKD